MRRHLAAAAVLAATLPALAACGGTATPKPAVPHPPSPASIAARLGCKLAGFADVSDQDAYDTVAYDSLVGPSGGSSLCEVSGSDVSAGDASDVITFASQAKETDWLHQNDLAQAGGAVTGSGYVGLVVGNLWIVTDGSGVAGLDNIASRLGGKAVTTF